FEVTPHSWPGGFQRQLLRYRYGNESPDDVQLSTAAHNSARFTYISPPGTIRNHDQTIVDRILDGGYFKAYGATGANALARAVRGVEPGVGALVIVISNDADDLLDPSLDSDISEPRGRAQYQTLVRRARTAASGSEALTDIAAPARTFLNAWVAHGTLA